MQRLAKREKEVWVVGGVELTAFHFVTKLPMNGTYIVDFPLVSLENATQYYFPNSPF
jgi:ribose transport system substrate-binding protein